MGRRSEDDAMDLSVKSVKKERGYMIHVSCFGLSWNGMECQFRPSSNIVASTKVFVGYCGLVKLGSRRGGLRNRCFSAMFSFFHVFFSFCSAFASAFVFCSCFCFCFLRFLFAAAIASVFVSALAFAPAFASVFPAVFALPSAFAIANRQLEALQSCAACSKEPVPVHSFCDLL